MVKFTSFAVLAIASSSDAFSLVSRTTNSNAKTVSFSSQGRSITNLNAFHHHQLPSRHNHNRFNFILNAEETSENSEVEEAQSEVVSEESEASANDDESSTEEESTTEPEEDPEITAMKNEIAQLESSLKQKNRDLNNLERLAEDYTKAGYARKVAEMESFRRRQSLLSTDNKMAARANVLASFLPILEKLEETTIKYEGDEFAKSYGALSWDFKNGLKDLGVTEYTVQEGDTADFSRIIAVKEEYSETFAKGTVIEPVAVGFEIEGNVMREAAAVVSLGSESAEEEKEESGAEGGEGAENEGEEETPEAQAE